MTESLRLAPTRELSLLLRPFGAYRELAHTARGEGAVWQSLRGPLYWSFFVATFVSYTTSADLVIEHFVWTPLMWSFIPFFQVVWLGVALRVVKHDGPFSHAVDLLFAGYAPWYAVLLAISAVCLFAPSASTAILGLIALGILPVAFVTATVMGVLLTFACFRAGLGLSRRHAAISLCVFYAGFGASIGTWFLATGQLTALLGAL
jgi:hypothetical protein